MGDRALPEAARGRLEEALDTIPLSAWSLPSSFVATGAHQGYRSLELPGGGWFDFVLEQFAPVYVAWGSWIEPGGFIVPHVDAGPYRERWQVPIITSGEFDDHDQQPGVPFRVEHWLPHSVWNTGAGPRIHLVIDRDVVANDTRAAFRTFPIPPERKEFVYG
jgi:hypothetical protein